MRELRNVQVEVSDGATLCVSEIDGDGVPVVLSHSLASSADDLRPLAQEFASRGHRVVWFDQRGHGASGSCGAVTVDRLAKGVVEVVQQRSAQGAIAVGHSSGGYALLALGSRAADLLSKLVVVGTSAELTSFAERAMMRYAKSPTMSRLQRVEPIGKAMVRLGSFGRDPNRDAVEQV